MAASILVVDDDPDLRDTTSRLLRVQGYEVASAEDGPDALTKLEQVDPDLVLMDVHMPGMTGIEVLEAMRKRGDARPVVMISAAGTIDLAVRAIQLGALDFLEKPARMERLKVSVENALRYARLSDEHARMCEQLGTSSELIGSGPAMREVHQLIAKVAPSEGRVLILGENGTGKELAANAIHKGSSRRDKPFVKVNCGAIPEELIESELFGHEKGAFTGAVAQRRGKFELGDKGTLFLDEIGDMPLVMQVKLLRVLQEGTFERVGGTRTIKVDVRVIAATHRDLRAMVANEQFREDLFYRLNVVTLTMPSLRERREDIPELAHVLLARAAERNGKRRLMVDDEAVALLARGDYPGNVRELGNLLERLVIMCDGSRIGREDVLRVLPRTAAEHAPAAPNNVAPRFKPGATFRQLQQRAEREILLEAIEAFGGNKSAAARALGLERAHFAKKCRALGIGDAEGSGSSQT